MSPTVAVCGFGRCGSTMVMEMLRCGGVPIAQPAHERSHELALGDVPLEDLVEQLAASGALDGHAVKLLDLADRAPLPTGLDWRFVWLDRNSVEQALSTVKFLTSVADLDIANGPAVAAFAHAVRDNRPRNLAALRRLGPVVTLQYERVLANPRKAAKQLRTLWPALDIDAAAAAVHDRTGECRPDLAFELGDDQP